MFHPNFIHRKWFWFSSFCFGKWIRCQGNARDFQRLGPSLVQEGAAQTLPHAACCCCSSLQHCKRLFIPSLEPPPHQPYSNQCVLSCVESLLWSAMSVTCSFHLIWLLPANLPYTQTGNEAWTLRSAHWGKTCFDKQSYITATKAGQEQAFRLQWWKLKIAKKKKPLDVNKCKPTLCYKM